MKKGDQYYSLFIAYGNIQIQQEVWEDGHLDHTTRDIGNLFLTKELAESKALDIELLFKNKNAIQRNFLE